MPDQPKGIIFRVSTGPLDKARELLANVPDARFGPGEVREVGNRQLVDMGMSWLIGRLQGDVFTKAEVEQTVAASMVKVLSEALGIRVNAMVADGMITFDYTNAEGERVESTVSITA